MKFPVYISYQEGPILRIILYKAWPKHLKFISDHIDPNAASATFNSVVGPTKFLRIAEDFGDSIREVKILHRQSV